MQKALTEKNDESPNPGNLGLLGALAVVPHADGLADAVQEPRGAGRPGPKRISGRRAGGRYQLGFVLCDVARDWRSADAVCPIRSGSTRAQLRDESTTRRPPGRAAASGRRSRRTRPGIRKAATRYFFGPNA